MDFPLLSLLTKPEGSFPEGGSAHTRTSAPRGAGLSPPCATRLLQGRCCCGRPAAATTLLLDPASIIVCVLLCVWGTGQGKDCNPCQFTQSFPSHGQGRCVDRQARGGGGGGFAAPGELAACNICCAWCVRVHACMRAPPHHHRSCCAPPAHACVHALRPGHARDCARNIELACTRPVMHGAHPRPSPRAHAHRPCCWRQGWCSRPRCEWCPLHSSLAPPAAHTECITLVHTTLALGTHPARCHPPHSELSLQGVKVDVQGADGGTLRSQTGAYPAVLLQGPQLSAQQSIVVGGLGGWGVRAARPAFTPAVFGGWRNPPPHRPAGTLHR